MTIIRVIALALVVAFCNAQARADDKYPSRLITIVVPLTPGTTIDILARLYADKLSRRFGQNVVVLNKPGAAGAIAGQTVATAAADGYTLLFANSGLSILKVMSKNLRFDPIDDFAGVTMIGQAPAIVTVAPSLGVKDLKDFIALAKSKPGSVNYGSAGIGSATHIAGAYFALRTGTDIVHVPYSVSSTIITDMLAGRLEAAFVPAAFVLPWLEDGRLRALAVSADEPMTKPIEITTAVSQGVDYRYGTWYGLLAPAKTPPAILKQLNEAIVEANADPDLIAKIRQQGINPQNVGLRDFDSHIRKEMEVLEPVLATVSSSQ